MRAFDPRASLSVVSLDGVWFDIAKTAEEVAKAAQPKAGTSTDLQLFRLSPLEDEVTNAKSARIEGAAALPEGETPLFYDDNFFLTLNNERQKPYFFRQADLLNAIKQTSGVTGGGEGGDLTQPPAIRVTPLGALVRSLERGNVKNGEPPPLLIAASDAAAVVERMSARGVFADGPPSVDEQTPKVRGGDDGAVTDPFFLSVPFGGSKRLAWPFL